MEKNRQRESGQATLVMVLVVGLIAVLTANTLGSILVAGVRVEADARRSDAAWYAAWAGIDELMYRLRAEQQFPDPGIYTINLTMPNGATVSAEIEGGENLKTIRSVGTFDGSTRKLEMVVQSPGSRANFVYATQSGEGGFEMEIQTQITGKDGTEGNVYSNGDLLGDSKSSGNSGSRVMGSIWAVGMVDSLGSQNNEGVYVQKDAWAGELIQCLAGERRISALPSGPDCTGGTYETAPSGTPEPTNLSSIDVAYWKGIALSGGEWNGNCIIGGGPGADCTNGTKVLGNIKVNGDVILPQNQTLTLNGTLWVNGDISFSSNNQVIVGEPWNKQTAVLIVAHDNAPVKGKVITSSNVGFVRNSQNAGIIVISQNTSQDCSQPAININSNTKTVVFIANDGCINVGPNSAMAGVIGYKVHIERNSTVEFDPSLAQKIVGGELTGWVVTSLREY